jgi:NDP-sugar pyrophosphorylase family protein
MIGGRPIITFAMEHLANAGVEQFIVNTHYLPHAYNDYFPDNTWKGIPIVFRYEPTLLDTAGGLKNIEDLLEKDEAILCYNGDIISDVSLKRLIESHEEHRPEVTLVLRSTGPLLNVNITKAGIVCDMRNTTGNAGVQSCLFTGIYALETSLPAHIRSGIHSIVPVLLERIRADQNSVRGVVIDEGQWSDIGSITEYERLKKEMEMR